MNEQKPAYVVCVDNSGYPVSLELRKIYLRLPDAGAEEDGFIRVVDESGEDYLYPSRFFVAIQVPAAVERAFSGAA
jgi:hypothetical protein